MNCVYVPLWRNATVVTAVVLGAALVPPVQLSELPMPQPAAIAVQLTGSSSDVVGALGDLFDHATYTVAPVLQQVLANWTGYLAHTVSDPSSLSASLSEIEDHVNGLVGAPLELFTAGAGVNGVYSSLSDAPVTVTGIGDLAAWAIDTILGGTNGTLDLTGIDHASVLSALVGILGGSSSLLGGLLAFTGSPLSGVLWGGLGTVLSPLIATYTDLSHVVSDISSGSAGYSSALTELLAMPGDAVSAFLTGTTIQANLIDNSSIDSLLSQVFGSTLAGGVEQLTQLLGISLDVATPITLGGLLSPGGSLFDAIGLELSGTALNNGLAIGLAGSAVGPIGSLIELDQAMAHAIGWDVFDPNPISEVEVDLGNIWHDLVSAL